MTTYNRLAIEQTAHDLQRYYHAHKYDFDMPAMASVNIFLASVLRSQKETKQRLDRTIVSLTLSSVTNMRHRSRIVKFTATLSGLGYFNQTENLR